MSNKWVLEVKSTVNGSIDKFKACLIAKGYTQRERIHHQETSSSIVRFYSTCLTLTIVARLDLEFFQMNINIVFPKYELDNKRSTCNNYWFNVWNNLHVPIVREIYM